MTGEDIDQDDLFIPSELQNSLDHGRYNGHGCEQTPGDGEGQGSLSCCSLWGRRVGHDLAT